jgi:hypothetical protein
MPYPGTITLDPAVVIIQNSTVGPFLIGGLLYIFATSNNQQNLRCFKSSDLGQTWSQSGSDSAALDASGEITCVKIGSTIYCCVLDTFFFPTERRIQILKFDTVSETFAPTIDTGISVLIGGVANEFLAAGYRASDNSIIFCYMGPLNPSPTRLFYALWDVGTETTGASTACGDTLAIVNWDCAAVLVGSTLSTFFYRTMDGAGNTSIVVQTLSSGNVLGVLTTLDTGFSGNPYQLFWSIEADELLLGWTPDTGIFNPVISSFQGPSAEPFVGIQSDYTYTQGSGFLDYPSLSAVLISGSQYLFMDGSAGIGNPDGYVIDGGTFTDIANPGVYFIPIALSLTPGVWGLTQFGSSVAGIFFFLGGSPPPPPTPATGAVKMLSGGGVYFPRFVNKTILHAQIARIVGPVNQIVSYREYAPLSWLYDFPNDNDLCLSREWRLYNRIDPQAMSCARKPDCFCGEEGARPWVEAPPGAVTFNPDKAIPLPNPVDVDDVILSFRVPIGFDGIILAQYHAYRGAGTFVEASGDIIWRVRVNGRYLRDMGNMQLSIGSPQTLSPVTGGLWLHSGNLVEYVVSAPNGSGNLPLPGQGNILAGLHGWFYPRI